MESQLKPQTAQSAFRDTITFLLQHVQHSLIGQLILYEKHLNACMQSLVACRCPMSLADAPLAKAGLDGSFLDLDIMTSFESTADSIATDAMVVEGDDIIPVGF